LVSELAVILPEITLVVGSILMLFLGRKKELNYFDLAAWGTALIIFAALTFNSYTAPTGYYFFQHVVIDTPALMGRFLLLLLGLMVVLASITDYASFELEHLHYSLLLLSLAGGSLLIVAYNPITLVLALELLTIPTYALVTGRRNRAAYEGALKYFIFGLVFLALMLYGLSIIYANLVGGGLNLGVLVFLGFLFFLSGFAFKVTLFPFHFWAPDAYQGSTPQVAGYLATVSKVAAFIALFRIIIFYGKDLGSPWAAVLYFLAISSMTFGNLAALTQNNLKRLLAYSGVAHAGYLLVPLVGKFWNSPWFFSSFLFYLLVYTLANLGAFLCLAVVTGKGEADISDYSGLFKSSPFVAVAFSLFLLSLGGFPPLAGFFGKFYLFGSAVLAGEISLVIIAVLNSVLSFGYYLRVIRVMFLEEGKPTPISISPWLYGTVYFLFFVVLTIPLYQSFLLRLTGLF
jgi:NADH-quinone oxidoreductase subunit N